MDHLSTRRARGRRASSRVTVVVLAVALTALGPGAIAKKDDPPAKDRNSCRGNTTSWNKLKVAAQDSGILEVTAVVFSDDSDVWEWKLKHNDEVSAKGTVKAKDADKSFKIVRDMGDFPGVDFIDFKAENTANGEICTSSVEY